MRVFAAVPLSDQARTAVAVVCDRLQAHGWPVRWVQEDGLHLTVRFYGEVPEDQIEGLGASLAEAVGRVGPMGMELADVGVFPSHRNPRVIWMGVVAPPALELLHDRVERAAAAQGFPARQETYRPHVTLGRVQRRARLADDASDILDQVDDTVGFLADRIVLYRSQTLRSGVCYDPLRVIQLEGVWAA